MNIIPVIDYLQGNVVLAQQGNRSKYLPVTSKLCSGSDIATVLDSILSLNLFNTIYIADLDCIENDLLDKSLWPKICGRYPFIEFWIDIGNFSNSWKQIMQSSPNARPIVGSESFTTNIDLSETIHALKSFNPLLSIDIKFNTILGPNDLLTTFTDWPQDVIILPLNHVGSNNGPDVELIKKIQTILPKLSLFYGGGVRDINDLISLSKLNLSGALIANSLHNGNINSQNLLSNNM